MPKSKKRKKKVKRYTKETWKKYLKSPHWQSTRARKMANSGFRCQECDNIHSLYVTHIHYKTVGCETDDDLNIYCKGCFDKAYQVKKAEVKKPKRPINSNEECPFDT